MLVCVDGGDPAAGAVVAVPACSCPLHGHLTGPGLGGAPVVGDQDDDLPPPPPSHLTPAPPQRFSSFRPRVEHIYEVPQFVTDGGATGARGQMDPDDDDDDEVGTTGMNPTSPLYSELDTTAFGTVGRRTPNCSRGGSRRQPVR